MNTKRIAPSIYEAKIEGRTFEIDGQNGLEYGGREWQLFEVTQGPFGEERTWHETYPTKRDALEDLPRVITLS